MQEVYLCRHGETEWNITGQHTSFTDIPLTENGIKEAECLRAKVSGKHFEKIFTSPLSRSFKTCQIAGFGTNAIADEDFCEWNYGDYEGKTTSEIQKIIPNWTIFRNGAKNGESIEEVEKRAKRAVDKIRKCQGDVIIFSHGHFLRVLGSVWIGFGASSGRFFSLSNGSLSILSYERGAPVFRVWNDTCHL